MKSTLTMLSAIMFGINAMGHDEDKTITSLYDGLLNQGGHPDAVDAWINDHFNADSFIYCLTSLGECKTDRDLFKQIIQDEFFGSKNLVDYTCDFDGEVEWPTSDTGVDITIDCEFKYEYVTEDASCTIVTSRTDHIYITDGKITQLMEVSIKIKDEFCVGIPIYIDPQEETEYTYKYTCDIKSPNNAPRICFNTEDKNPCNMAQRQSEIYYFPSCTSCCNFIQCDEFGVAFDMPCAPGTGWDQTKQTCTREGACSTRHKDTTSKPTTTARPTKGKKGYWPSAKPTQAPTTTASTSKPTGNNKYGVNTKSKSNKRGN
jgi:hypothetical protein